MTEINDVNDGATFKRRCLQSRQSIATMMSKATLVMTKAARPIIAEGDRSVSTSHYRTTAGPAITTKKVIIFPIHQILVSDLPGRL